MTTSRGGKVVAKRGNFGQEAPHPSRHSHIQCMSLLSSLVEPCTLV